MGYLCMPCSYFWVRTSKNVPFAKFAALRLAELPRISLPRTPANRGFSPARIVDEQLTTKKRYLLWKAS
jgi:hypothetical protein